MTGIHENTTLVNLGTEFLLRTASRNTRRRRRRRRAGGGGGGRAAGSATRLFIDSILRRNKYLGLVRGLLGTRATTTPLLLPTTSMTTLPTTSGSTAGEEPSIPPPCGLWANGLATVGRQDSHGATPVFTILSDRLATWIEPG
jgi:hypothetical protein